MGLLAAGCQPWNKDVCAASGDRFAYCATLAVYIYQVRLVLFKQTSYIFTLLSISLWTLSVNVSTVLLEVWLLPRRCLCKAQSSKWCFLHVTPSAKDWCKLYIWSCMCPVLFLKDRLSVQQTLQVDEVLDMREKLSNSMVSFEAVV